MALVMAIASLGCNKYLEKEPDNRTQLNSPEKVSQLLASAYPAANYMAFAEGSTDNVGDRGAGSADNTAMDPFMFRDVRSNNQDSPEFYWGACYKAIASANIALEAIAKAPDQQRYAAQKGEALVARAYAHFMLATFFSKVYDETTAASDPGIPYVTEVEDVVVKQYERRTVAYVYEQIEKDLLAGLPLIRDDVYTVPAYHFTRKAANAFAARYYLFRKNWDKVIEHTNDMFATTDVAGLLRPWNTEYLTMTRLELFADYTRATRSSNLLLCETASWYFRQYAIGRYAYDATIFRQIGINVPVLSAFGRAQWAFAYQSYGGDNTVYIPKLNEYFVRVSVNAEIGTGYIMAPLFTVEEALFNRAEAMLYKNNTAGAVALLNQYLSTRIYNYNPADPIHRLTESKATTIYGGSPASALLNTVLDLKRAEFIHEGIRWFDILRYNIPVEHTALNGEVYTLEADDKRRVFQIPESATLSGVELNPR